VVVVDGGDVEAAAVYREINPSIRRPSSQESSRCRHLSRIRTELERLLPWYAPPRTRGAVYGSPTKEAATLA
jgi:hypothetical protein